MAPTDADLLERIAVYARNAHEHHDPAHDISHVERVVTNARAIIDRDEVARGACDSFVVLAACWLHDIVQLPKGSSPPGEAARRSAIEAGTYLRTLEIDERRIKHICEMVRAHSFSGAARPVTVEAAIVQDADRLDALGAIGMARLWVTAAERRSQLYDPADPMACARPLDDGRFALDHITTKLLKIPDLMHTDTARRIAHERAGFVREFRDQLLLEVGCRS